MARQLKNHPGFELNDVAAEAFDAYEDKYGVRTVNSARRSKASQQNLIDRWDQGGVYNRPPYLYEPARPPEESLHVRNDGEAVDIADWRVFKEHCQEFGFVWYGERDVVHFTFVGRPSPASSSGDGSEAAGDPGGYNPFGIAWSKGLQKIARLYGYRGDLDAKFGPGSMGGFAQFLRANWGYVGNDELGPVMWAAIARWLRARWGYVGDDVPGPVMRAALLRAEAQNYQEL